MFKECSGLTPSSGKTGTFLFELIMNSCPNPIHSKCLEPSVIVPELCKTGLFTNILNWNKKEKTLSFYV